MKTKYKQTENRHSRSHRPI